MKKVYIVAEQLDYGLYDMANARAFETEIDAVLAAELSGLEVIVLDMLEPQTYGTKK
jgi:hypothetical protein